MTNYTIRKIGEEVRYYCEKRLIEGDTILEMDGKGVTKIAHPKLSIEVERFVEGLLYKYAYYYKKKLVKAKNK